MVMLERRARLVWVCCALCVVGLALTPAACLALGWGFSPEAICTNDGMASLSVLEHSLSPANGATVQVGAPMTFSGSSESPVTFAVASSSASLSSPDIDGGLGSGKAGSSPSIYEYTFTSTKATATARTVYWSASFSDSGIPACAGMAAHTYTTEVRTLTVLPETPPAASPPATPSVTTTGSEPGEVSLVSTKLQVQGDGVALVTLDCTKSMGCNGKLTLTSEAKGKKRRTSTVTIGTTGFSISGHETKTVKIKLDTAGRALLRRGHGRLSTHLAILDAESGSEKSDSVWLVQERTTVKPTVRKGGKGG
jgi:hypothetical protein